jgi:hypothetical protein
MTGLADVGGQLTQLTLLNWAREQDVGLGELDGLIGGGHGVGG